MSRSHDDLPADLAPLGARLRAERPVLAPIALDAVHQRVARSAARRRRSRRPSLAVALCLCFGIVLSSTGTGMAISGLSSDSETAVQAQYPKDTTVAAQGEAASTPTPATPTTAAASAAPTLAPTDADLAPEAAVNASAGGTDAAQSTQQLAAAAGDATLPFTGFAAIPVVGLGIVLLAGGLVLRRRQRPGLE
jgi:hypothetical protein